MTSAASALYESIVLTRRILCIGLCIAALSMTETTAAASLRVTVPTNVRQTASATRRAERLRKRLESRSTTTPRKPRTTAAARRKARMDTRSQTTRSTPTTDSASFIDRVLELTNEAREKEGLPPLSLHPTLQQTAQAYAQDMAARGFFGHEDPDGGSSGDRIREGGYSKPTCNCSWTYGTGENLAKGQDTPEKAVKDWLASPGHRANILSKKFEDIGIGYFDEHWVQHFGLSKVLQD